MKQKLTRILLSCAFVMLSVFGIAQHNTPNSLGPAPQVPNVLHQVNPPQTQNVISHAWCYNGAGPFQLNSQTLANTTLTPVGATVTFGFPAAAAWVTTVQKMYVVDQLTPFALYTVDTTTGVRTFIANCSGLPQNSFTGMTWDASTGTMYGVSSTLAVSQIFTVNITTGVCTPIGAASAVCPGAIMVNAAPGGSLFSVDIVNDNLYRWNKVTGVATLVGSLGVDANFGQDGHFDLSDGKYYWAAALNGPSIQLRIIDTLTGSSVIAGVYAGQVETLAIRPLCGAGPSITSTSTAAAVCAGNSVTLTGGGGLSYSWSGGVTNGVSFVPTATTTYTVTGANLMGCTNTSTITVTVNPLPTVTANSTAAAVCIGNPVTLTGGGASTYTWNNSVTNGVAFTPAATTTYMVTGTDGNGCINTATTTVTVNPLPTVTASSSASTVCSGDLVTLTGGGATSYTWDNSVTDGVAFNATATTTYMVTGTNANGCMNTATITVTVNPLPTVVANSTATAICIGDMVTLTGGGAISYTWDNSVMDGVAFNPASTTTYMVTGTGANGCMNTATTTVTVNALPIVNLGPDVTQCGGTVLLDAQNSGSTYLWSDASSSMTDTVSVTGNYSVVVTDANGCVSTDTAMITFNATLVVNLGQDVTQCGGSIILDAQNLGSTYLWNDATTMQTNTVSMSGTYYVDVTDVNGCMGSDTVMITIYTPPTVTGSAAASTVCVDDASIALTGSPAGGTWTGPGVTGSMFNPSAAGVGSQSVGYSFTDANGCESSAIVTIQVSACTGIIESSLENNVSVYPNPSNGAFTIAVNANVNDLTIEILDMQGRVVYFTTENNVTAGYTNAVSMNNVAEGIYMIRLTGNGTQQIIKVAVQH